MGSIQGRSIREYTLANHRCIHGVSRVALDPGLLTEGSSGAARPPCPGYLYPRSIQFACDPLEFTHLERFPC
jgi:hypothetical protein